MTLVCVVHLSIYIFYNTFPLFQRKQNYLQTIPFMKKKFQKSHEAASLSYQYEFLLDSRDFLENEKLPVWLTYYRGLPSYLFVQ